MKNLKKCLSLCLALAIVLTLSSTAVFAAGSLPVSSVGNTTIALPWGGELTLSNPIVRVDMEPVSIDIGSCTYNGYGGGSFASISEIQSTPVYVIPLGTVITYPAGYMWNDTGYDFYEDESAYGHYWGGIGNYDPDNPEPIVIDYKGWLNTTEIWAPNFFAYPESGWEIIPERTVIDGNYVYEYYSEDDIAKINPIFFRFVAPESGTGFTDVPAGKWYSDPVAWAVGQGITSGTSANTFSPNQQCTRAQVVTFLWAMAGKPAPKSDSNPFVDVKAGAWYYDAVLWAVEQGITSGIDATHFGPNNKVTREQFVTFLWAYDGKPAPENSASPFKDVTAGKWYTNPVLWAVENGVTSGIGGGKFGTGTICTRAQVVTFLYAYVH